MMESNIVWKSHLGDVEDNFGGADGYLEFPNGQRLELDMITFDETELTEADREMAASDWREERVTMLPAERFGAPSIVIPFPQFTSELLREALHRFKP